jgi:hypothetical protein
LIAEVSAIAELPHVYYENMLEMKKSEHRGCPFCEVEPARLVSACEAAIAIKDSYPITEGHTLVLPRSHVKSIFDLCTLEQGALWAFVAEIRLSLARMMSVDAFQYWDQRWNSRRADD